MNAFLTDYFEFILSHPIIALVGLLVIIIVYIKWCK